MDRKQRSELLKGREVRLSSTLLECRDAEGGLAIRGYASTTGQAYDMGWYQETISRGAFTKTLSENPDVQLLINHGGLPMARTTNGTLTLSEDQSGLYFEAQMDAEDPDAAKVARKVAAGLMDQCSFAFRVTRQTWDEDYENRSIDEVSLDRGDVSVVNYGANPHTSVSLRSFFADLADLDDEKLAELREDPTVITVLRKLVRPEPAVVVTFNGAPMAMGQGGTVVDVATRTDDSEIEPAAAAHDLALFRARAQALKFRQK